MLRFAWRKKDTTTTILQPELGMPYWRTPGAYMRQGQLQEFINQLGHISGVETPTDSDNSFLFENFNTFPWAYVCQDRLDGRIFRMSQRRIPQQKNGGKAQDSFRYRNHHNKNLGLTWATT